MGAGSDGEMKMRHTKQLFAFGLSFLLVLGCVYAWAQQPFRDIEELPKPCDAVILAGVCDPGPGEVRIARPLPEGCVCPESVTGWSCWLSGREASAAQELGPCETEACSKAGVPMSYWRIWAEDCESAKKHAEFQAETPGFVVDTSTAKALDITDEARPVFRGGYSGKPAVAAVPTAGAVVEALRLKAEESVQAAEMMKIETTGVRAPAPIESNEVIP